ncbi:MAG: hypothetical protein Q9180_000261 [Flavoplaca navasiana]
MFTLVDFPNEIKAMILGHLEKRSIKQARLVCKDLAIIGESRLVDTIYISPREKDMEVFDGITTGKFSIRRSVKHVVFDSAQFTRQEERTYFTNLCEQLSQPQLKYLMMANHDLTNLVKTILGSDEDLPNPQSLKEYGSSRKAFERCQHNKAFNTGLEQYFVYAKQQRRLLDPNWSARVVRGLQRLGDIDIAMIDSTFDRTFFERNDELAARSPNIWVDDPNLVDNIFECRFSDDRIPMALYHFKGTSTIGSPVARSWPPTALYPSHAGYFYPSVSEDGLRDDNISNGCFEIKKFAQLLKRASKYPREFGALGHPYRATGIPHYLFEADNIRCLRLQDFAANLKGLYLNIVAYLGVMNESSTQGLEGLKAYFNTPLALETLWLKLPIKDRRFSYDDVFPPIYRFSLGTLKHFDVAGLSLSYSQLAFLLFLAFPNISSFTLGYISLEDGSWDDIIEGLRRSTEAGLEECTFWGSLDSADMLYNPPNYPMPNQYTPNLAPEVLARIHDYIRTGGRHPSLTSNQPIGAVIKYWDRLNTTLDRIKRGLY